MASKGDLGRCVGWSVSVNLTSITQSVLAFQKPLTSRSPRSSVGSSVDDEDGLVLEAVEVLDCVGVLLSFVVL